MKKILSILSKTNVNGATKTMNNLKNQVNTGTQANLPANAVKNSKPVNVNTGAPPPPPPPPPPIKRNLKKEMKEILKVRRERLTQKLNNNQNNRSKAFINEMRKNIFQNNNSKSCEKLQMFLNALQKEKAQYHNKPGTKFFENIIDEYIEKTKEEIKTCTNSKSRNGLNNNAGTKSKTNGKSIKKIVTTNASTNTGNTGVKANAPVNANLSKVRNAMKSLNIKNNFNYNSLKNNISKIADTSKQNAVETLYNKNANQLRYTKEYMKKAFVNAGGILSVTSMFVPVPVRTAQERNTNARLKKAKQKKQSNANKIEAESLKKNAELKAEKEAVLKLQANLDRVKANKGANSQTAKNLDAKLALAQNAVRETAAERNALKQSVNTTTAKLTKAEANILGRNASLAKKNAELKAEKEAVLKLQANLDRVKANKGANSQTAKNLDAKLALAQNAVRETAAELVTAKEAQARLEASNAEKASKLATLETNVKERSNRKKVIMNITNKALKTNKTPTVEDLKQVLMNYSEYSQNYKIKPTLNKVQERLNKLFLQKEFAIVLGTLGLSNSMKRNISSKFNKGNALNTSVNVEGPRLLIQISSKLGTFTDKFPELLPLKKKVDEKINEKIQLRINSLTFTKNLKITNSGKNIAKSFLLKSPDITEQELRNKIIAANTARNVRSTKTYITGLHNQSRRSLSPDRGSGASSPRAPIPGSRSPPRPAIRGGARPIKQPDGGLFGPGLPPPPPTRGKRSVNLGEAVSGD